MGSRNSYARKGRDANKSRDTSNSRTVGTAKSGKNFLIINIFGFLCIILKKSSKKVRVWLTVFLITLGL